MLSNQMRGRAIRVFKQNPEKSSNIWHLVCLNPWKEVMGAVDGEISDDYSLLERRMEHFLGLHYEEDIIENGIGRLSIIKEPFDEANVEVMNRRMLELSGQRTLLKERWNRSLALHKNMDIVEETEVTEASVPKTGFTENLTVLIVAAVLFVVVLIFRGIIAARGGTTGLFTILLVGIGGYAFTKLPIVIRLFDARKRLQAFGDGIRKALVSLHLMESGSSRVVVESEGISQQIYLSGGTGRDKALFTKCVNEFFGEIENQRYLLVRAGKLRGQYDFYAVPECFGKRKEDVQLFYDCIKPYMGNYDLVYTRNENGRKVLLEARIKSIANQQNKTKARKKLKSF